MSQGSHRREVSGQSSYFDAQSNFAPSTEPSGLNDFLSGPTSPTPGTPGGAASAAAAASASALPVGIQGALAAMGRAPEPAPGPSRPGTAGGAPLSLDDFDLGIGSDEDEEEEVWEDGMDIQLEEPLSSQQGREEEEKEEVVPSRPAPPARLNPMPPRPPELQQLVQAPLQAPARAQQPPPNRAARQPFGFAPGGDTAVDPGADGDFFGLAMDEGPSPAPVPVPAPGPAQPPPPPAARAGALPPLPALRDDKVLAALRRPREQAQQQAPNPARYAAALQQKVRMDLQKQNISSLGNEDEWGTATRQREIEMMQLSQQAEQGGECWGRRQGPGQGALEADLASSCTQATSRRPR